MTDPRVEPKVEQQPAPGAPTPRARRDRVLPLWLYGVLVAEAIALVWLRYQRPEERGGYPVPYVIGWVGTISMCVMHVYSIRRRVGALRNFGPLRRWLQFHIFMGLTGALCVTYHAVGLETVWSYGGINYLFVLVVVASGIWGRYLFSMLPKGAAGERLTARDIDDEIKRLEVEISRTQPTPELAAAVAKFTATAETGVPRSLAGLVAADWRARRARRELEAAVVAAMPVVRKTHGKTESIDLVEVLRLEAFRDAARRRVVLGRRLAMLQGAESTFRSWTIFHKPLTFLLLGSTLLHVYAHYIYGGYSG